MLILKVKKMYSVVSIVSTGLKFFSKVSVISTGFINKDKSLKKHYKYGTYNRNHRIVGFKH